MMRYQRQVAAPATLLATATMSAAATKPAELPSLPRKATAAIWLYWTAFVPLLGLVAVVLAYFGETWVSVHIAAISTAGFIWTYRMIPRFCKGMAARGLAGRDLHRPWLGDQRIPESLGLIAALTFLVSAVLVQLLMVHRSAAQLLDLNAALLAICFMTFLGFLDDVLDLRWRYKLVLPIVASLPLVIAYQGPTAVILPRIVTAHLPDKWMLRRGTGLFSMLPSSLASALPGSTAQGLVELGWLYHLYMILLSVFCSNAINIYSGLNGLEVGQSLVICAFIIIESLLELLLSPIPTLHNSRQLTTILLCMPFYANSLALYYFNKYPAVVFVGDTYTYFAGVFFAASAIMGHFSRSLLLFFLPQILNFLISLPQLVGIVRCPRHRVPSVDQQTRKLVPSPNLTFLNFVLRVTGPLDEPQLVRLLLQLQVAACTTALLVRRLV